MRNKCIKTKMVSVLSAITISFCTVVTTLGIGFQSNAKELPTKSINTKGLPLQVAQSQNDKPKSEKLSIKKQIDCIYIGQVRGTTDGSLNIRKYPSPNDTTSIIKSIPDGTTVYVLQELNQSTKSTWLEIRLDDNTTGYVNKKFITKL